MRYGMLCVVGLALLAMATPSAAAMVYDIPVAPAGDRVYYRSWGYYGTYTSWEAGANPNVVSHSYEPGAGESANTYLTFDLASIAGKGDLVSGVTLNYYVESIWTDGRNGIGNLNGIGTVYADQGTGWRYFDVTSSIATALAAPSGTADFIFSYTGYSGFSFSSAEGGRPAYLQITTAEASPVPVAASMFLLAPGLLGLAAVRKLKR